ncbi:biotin-dependent carboxyltransferase family protein [Arthrobacter sp. 35W]|uniref:5-oxoprolinase subunit C family protein n=1 Tax=Arthrobacter sp. 35W TaxID=1132441 RepID=UPI00040E89B1|nr:biotin-dependent carboxyltransferase family protein [Arthrobacter sp. 35W]
MKRLVTLDVAEAGWLSTYQDLGRTNAEAMGVPSGGAADQHSAAVGNILVGNPRTGACIEIMGGRFSFTPSNDILIAVTGTPAELTIGGCTAPLWTPTRVPAGAKVTIARATEGVRSYLCIAGAIHTAHFMGSCAPDARMGFAQKLSAGDQISVLTANSGYSHPYFDNMLFRLPVPIPTYGGGIWTVDVVDGPEMNATPGIRELMTSSLYTVGGRSDHVGLRLDGPVLHPEGLGEITSHGVPVGAIEIPHSDELIILGRYRTLTAGYPIVAFATTAAQSMLGQAGPGRRITFNWVAAADAVRHLRYREHELNVLEDAVHSAFTAAGLPLSESASPL